MNWVFQNGSFKKYGVFKNIIFSTFDDGSRVIRKRKNKGRIKYVIDCLKNDVKGGMEMKKRRRYI